MWSFVDCTKHRSHGSSLRCVRFKISYNINFSFPNNFDALTLILTNNLCFRSLKAENTIVRCGEHNAAKINEPLPHQDRPAKHISIHPSFNMKNLYYDFALVHTKTDYDLNEEYIQPICLPDQFGQVPSFDDEPCFTMGYGKDGYGK